MVVSNRMKYTLFDGSQAMVNIKIIMI